MFKFINIISDQAKFPLSYIKGSEKQRFKQARNLTKCVFDYMENSGKNNQNAQSLKNAIDKYTSPHKIKILIENENINYSQGSLQEIISVQEYNDYIKRNLSAKNIPDTNELSIAASLDGYKLFLRFKNGKIKHKYTVLHELRHLFDRLCNPKMSVMPRRMCTVDMTHTQYKAYKEILEMFLNYLKYPNFYKSKKEILKRFENIPNYKKINILQGLRNSIKTEINAHSQELKEQSKKPFTQFLNILDNVLVLKIVGKYDEKLKFANKLLSDCIKKERLKNK